MSWEGDSTSHEGDLTAVLSDISAQLRLLNARIEDAFKTGIEIDDIETLEEAKDGN